MNTTQLRQGTFLMCIQEHIYDIYKIKEGTLAKIHKIDKNYCELNINKINIKYIISDDIVLNNWGIDLKRELISIGLSNAIIKKMFSLPKNRLSNIKRQFLILRRSGITNKAFISEITSFIDLQIMDYLLK